MEGSCSSSVEWQHPEYSALGGELHIPEDVPARDDSPEEDIYNLAPRLERFLLLSLSAHQPYCLELTVGLLVLGDFLSPFLSLSLLFDLLASIILHYIVLSYIPISYLVK